MSSTHTFSRSFEIGQARFQVVSFPLGLLACNCSIIYGEETREALVIDPGGDAAAVLDFVRKHRLTVTAVLHTHAHFDHIGQSEELGDSLSCPLYLHPGDKPLHEALAVQARWFGMQIGTPRPIAHWLEDEQAFGLRLTTCDSDAAQHTQVATIFTPGHTPGSCSFFLGNTDLPLLFTGDTLFQNSIGRTDLPGGDSAQLQRSIKDRLWQLPEEAVCVPGHGPITTIGQEMRTNPFVGG